MERKIGETFEFEGKWLKVKEEDAKNACRNCYLVAKECSRYLSIIGECLDKKRSDNKNIVFEDITYELEEQPQEVEQPQEEQPKLNLCEILKYCPKGFKLYSSIHGTVTFVGLTNLENSCRPIIVQLAEGKGTTNYSKDGRYFINYIDAECCLFPSKDQRDWSKFTAPWYKKEKFDPKTLKAFDKVLVKVTDSKWKVSLFSHCDYNYVYPYVCVSSAYKYCIPYNDETKHLVGTKDEAPEYYRYWED